MLLRHRQPSAGCGDPATPHYLEWADIIFVMEKAHRSKLQRRFGKHLKRARVVCLDIPDDYAFMQPELVTLLERKVGPYLRQPQIVPR